MGLPSQLARRRSRCSRGGWDIVWFPRKELLVPEGKSGEGRKEIDEFYFVTLLVVVKGALDGNVVWKKLW